MLFQLQYVQFHVGVSQQIDAVAVGNVLAQVVHRVVDVCGRVGLIVGAISVFHGNGGVHGQSGVKESVVAEENGVDRLAFFEILCGRTAELRRVPDKQKYHIWKRRPEASSGAPSF